MGRQSVERDACSALRPHHAIPGIVYRSAEYARDQLECGNWLDVSIGESLRRTAERTPNKPAVIDPNGSVNFRELDAQTKSVAASLLELGLQPGDRALFQVGTTKEFFIAFFGCMKAGAVPVCTLPQYRLSEMRHFAEVTSAKAIFVQADITPSFNQVAFALELAGLIPGLNHVIIVRGEHGGAIPLEQMSKAFDVEVARAKSASAAPGILTSPPFNFLAAPPVFPKSFLGCMASISARRCTSRNAINLPTMTLHFGACH